MSRTGTEADAHQGIAEDVTKEVLLLAIDALLRRKEPHATAAALALRAARSRLVDFAEVNAHAIGF